MRKRSGSTIQCSIRTLQSVWKRPAHPLTQQLNHYSVLHRAHLHLLKKLKPQVHLPAKATRPYCVDVRTNGGPNTVSRHLLHELQYLTVCWSVDGGYCVKAAPLTTHRMLLFLYELIGCVHQLRFDGITYVPGWRFAMTTCVTGTTEHIMTLSKNKPDPRLYGEGWKGTSN